MICLFTAAEKVGLKTLSLKVDFDDLKDKIPLPCIIHWERSHFIIVYRITKNKVFVSDPMGGLITYSINEFIKGWLMDNSSGNVIVLEPSATFNDIQDIDSKSSFNFFVNYLKPYSSFLRQVFIGLIVGIIVSLIFPFLSQSLVDIGIGNQDIKFVKLILIAGLILSISTIVSDYIQSRIMLYVSDKMNINMISDFIAKILKLPISFFERKMISDILLRIGDHDRIQNFVVSTLLGMSVSVLSFIVYSGIMIFYNLKLFLVFIAGNILFAFWIYLFLDKRRKLDYAAFKLASINQNELLQILDNIPDIKVNNLAKLKQWQWENSRLDIYNLKIKALNLSQIQGMGSSMINKTMNILISFFSASAVITGEMTLGMMMSAQYILGQLNGPVGQFLGYIQSYQDAKISLKRVSEVIFDENEEVIPDVPTLPMPKNTGITLNDVTFHYNPNYEPVLKNISLKLPFGKMTAIVGESGSGKTTLMKLLLRFYNTYSGEISLDGIDINSINIDLWRSKCGTVLQDGKIMNGTILYNITLPAWMDYLNSLSNLSILQNTKLFRLKSENLKDQELYPDSLIHLYSEIDNLRKQEQTIVDEKLETDSLLYISAMLSKEDYYKSKINFLSSAQSLKSNKTILNEAFVKNKDVSNQKKILIEEYKEKLILAQIQLVNAKNNLLSKIDSWENFYVLKSPNKGKVFYINLLRDNNFIHVGEAIVSIIPDTQENEANIKIPFKGAGKIQTNQKVRIKLEDYPFKEFGTLVGSVKNISNAANIDYYLVNISFPDGLKSNYGKELVYKENMQGVAEIITKEKSIFSRIFEQITYVFNQ